MDALKPEKVSDATAEFEKAKLKLRSRNIPGAIAAYHMAESLGYDPDACAGGRWLCHMLQGDYDSAWSESDAIDRRGRPDPNRFWDGRPLDGACVMVRCLHGLGDSLQFARYLPLLREQGSNVIVEIQPRLKALFAASNLAEHVMTWGEPEPRWDTQIEIVELPRIFRTTLDNIPNQIPYLRVSNPKPRAGTRKLHVGMVWIAGAYNPARSIPLKLLRPVFDVSGCEFFSLQAGPERLDLADLSVRVRDLHDPEVSILEEAGKLVTLDLLITVDTMMAHLGGALGMPVWTLLPFEADWRWMLDRADSPWYPTMRLFRQSTPGDWSSLIACVCAELTAAAARAA